MKKITSLIGVLFWPIALLVEVWRSKRRKLKKLVWMMVVICFYLPLWAGLIGVAAYQVPKILFNWGVIDNPTTFPTSGPSMLPTLQEADEVVLVNPKKNKLSRGDIVTFGNQETEGNSFIKRIVGLGGERILLKQGAVWIDGRPLAEKYTFENRPTFGNTFLTECEEKEIPQGSVAVMGDNRALSWDSRAIGWIDLEDLTGVRKEAVETMFESESEVDKKYTTTPFDQLVAVQEINKVRNSYNTRLLMTNNKIAAAAIIRAEDISANFDAWKNGESSVETTLDKSGYRSNLTHEYVTFGYLTEAELVAQMMQIQQEKNMFLSEKFTEAGVGVVVHTVGQCSYPIVVTILAWPSVPTYDQKTIDWWKNETVVLSKNIQNYQSWVGFSEKDQSKLKELINTAARMVVISDRISKKMVASEWLTTADYSEIKTYDGLFERHNQLNDELWPDNPVRGWRSEPIEVAW